MNDNELIILFTAAALSGMGEQANKGSPAMAGETAVNMAVAALAALKNKGISWPGPSKDWAVSPPQDHPTRDELTTP